MNIKAEDFPLYAHLVKLNQPGVEIAKRDFAAACAGGDREEYAFAIGIQTIAVAIPVGVIPGTTAEMNAKTLRSCLEIFKRVAAGTSRDAENARFMVADFASRGLGLQ